jgi:hypothetical protein
MGLRDELSDPWAYLIGAVAGGAAWAVGVPVAAAAGVGAVVLGAKALAGSLLGRERPRFGLLPIRGGTVEERWLRRAERGLRSLEGLARSARPGPVGERAALVGDKARETIDAMRRLAGQASAVSIALKHIDPVSLTSDAERLQTDVRTARDPQVRGEMKRSLEAIKDQLAVHERLTAARKALLARMESGAIGLEGLVARVAEVLALQDTSISSAQGLHRIDELADELEGLRSGLVETEDLSRRALSAYQDRAG